ncbi:HEAT repeat domain-containing protein [Streptomyces albidoflavus]
MAALEALVQPVPGHRAVVLRALGNRLSTGEFGSEVRRALTEPDAEVREAVIAAVGGWRDHTERVADDLVKAASDAEPAVRERARRALSSPYGDQVLNVLLAGHSDEDAGAGR